VQIQAVKKGYHDTYRELHSEPSDLYFKGEEFKLSGDNWHKKSAKEKFDIVWDLCQKFSDKQAKWPKEGLVSEVEKFVQVAEPKFKNFDARQDHLPKPDHEFIDSKLGYSVGLVSTVKIIPNKEHPFTGIFQTGSEHCLMRLATTVPIINEEKKQEIYPYNCNKNI